MVKDQTHIAERCRLTLTVAYGPSDWERCPIVGEGRVRQANSVKHPTNIGENFRLTLAVAYGPSDCKPCAVVEERRVALADLVVQPANITERRCRRDTVARGARHEARSAIVVE